MKPNLTTQIKKQKGSDPFCKDLIFRNPVTVASGTFGTRDEYSAFVDYGKLGAVITKTITVRPRAGNP